jgi:hypothetical protein
MPAEKLAKVEELQVPERRYAIIIY